MGNWLFKRGRPARPVNRRAVSEQAVGPRRAVVLAASCSALLLAGPARAADINWIDPNGGAFQGAADWSGGVVPGVNDAAFFNLAATYAVTFVGSPTNQRAEFRRGTVSFDLNSNTYTLTASAPGVRSLAVAEDAGDLAALTITDGTVSAALVSVAPATNTRGTLSVGSGGVLNTSNSVFVGLSGGEGTLNVSQGGDVTIGGILTLGGGTDAGGVGGEGRATVSGAGSTLRVDNQFQVGGQRGGSGELTISSGGSVSSTSSTVIGVAAPGLVTVDGTSSTFNVTSTFMTIGSTDLSTLRVRNGGDVVGSTETFLSNSADDSALLHVTGGGSRFATTNRLTVGRFGTGEVLVEAGGAVSTTEGRLSEAAGSSGLATVRGPDSSWTTTGAMRVGQAGTGTLRVLNGATVTSGNSSSVGEGNGTGLAEVSNGGTWTSNSLNVGTGGGGGTVNVGPAGTLSTGTLTLGAAGTVNVDGGTVSVTGLARQAGSVLNFNAGTFDFRSGMTIGTNGPLGDTVVLTTACIVLPLWLTRRRVDFTGAKPLFAFFIAIGLGFMLVETSQMQRLIIALGHPTYGLSVVLFAVLLSSGAGSYFTSGITPENVASRGTPRLVLAVVVLAAFGVATPWAAHAIEPLATVWRVLASVALLFPIGLVMGMAFPVGITLAATRWSALTPWFWGLNGAASVLASVLSVCIALTWSISTAFWAGWISYVVALIAFAAAARQRAVAAP